MDGDAPVWVVDPVDGTTNFARGRRHFAVLVALVHRGETTAAWIYDPISDSMATAQRGAGTVIDGERVRIAPPPMKPEALCGVVVQKYLRGELRERAHTLAPRLLEYRGFRCVGHDYLALLQGRKHFQLYWRTWPWDHAAGVLLVQEAGGVAWRPDGGVYRANRDTKGLLIAANEGLHASLAELLFYNAL